MYAGDMKWPRFLGGRRAESEKAQEPPAQELEHKYAAESATPPSEQPTTSEPARSTDPFRPEPGETVGAPHEKDAVSGILHNVELVRYWTQGRDEMAEVRDDTGSWSVLVASLQPVPPDS
jgi:hypothetical protein